MKPYNTDQTKKEEVREMFDNIAPKYDLLNHTLSMSIDRVWRRRVVGEVRRAKPGRILDVATGTGDLAIAMARRIIACEAIFAGMSSGAAMLAAVRTAQKIERGNIVVVFPDRAEKYLSTTMFDEFSD